MDQRWYVAQLKAGRERVAIHGLKEQGFESYYPEMETTRIRNGRVVDGTEPLFPRYLFLRSDEDAGRWRAVNSTRGVARLLGNDAPSPIADREIEQLQFRERSGLLRHPYRRAVRSGDLVEFRLGTLVGLQGVCQWTKRERVAVLLNLLGKDTVTVVPRDRLKLAAA